MLSCLIIEDEPIAAEVLEDYVRQVSFLSLKGICKDALFALEHLQREQIDVLFLDIHLPKLKGLDFLRSLNYQPQTILTTAYQEYALEAFEVNVVDYLMKPIGFSRFLKAVNKLERSLPTPPTQAVISEQLLERPFRFFNVNKKMVKVYYDEIIYLESLKDYTRIVTTSQSLVTRFPLSDLEALLQPYHFLRIHRSYMVAVAKIQAYTATTIEIAGNALPIGRSYQALVNQVMNHKQ